jgi:hypothetical protein
MDVVSHAGQHADANAAIMALQAKVGVDESAVETSLDFRVTILAAAVADKVGDADPRLSDARTPTAHTHDDRYYTDAEVEALLAGKADAGHTHPAAQAFPVGSVFLAVVATNPATLLGYGTWVAFGAGRALVGVNGADADFDAAEKTGGAKDVTLTAAQSGVPAHTHPVTDPGHTHVQGVNTATTGGLSGYAPDTSTNTRANSGYATSSATTGVTVGNSTAADAAAAHNNMPPFVVVYLWKRTA